MHEHKRINKRNKKPLLLYDGECAFCYGWACRWKGMTGKSVTYKPFQEEIRQLPDISEEEFLRSIKFVSPDGSIRSGAHAVFSALSSSPYAGWMLWAYEKIPGVSAMTEIIYSIVARHRHRIV